MLRAELDPGFLHLPVTMMMMMMMTMRWCESKICMCRGYLVLMATERTGSVLMLGVYEYIRA